MSFRLYGKIFPETTKFSNYGDFVLGLLERFGYKEQVEFLEKMWTFEILG